MAERSAKQKTKAHQPNRKEGGLEVNDDMVFQRRSWRVQRVAWIVMILIALLGLAGGFGEGPIANAAVEAAGVSIRYDRYPRLKAPTRLEVQITSRAGSTARLWLGSDWLSSFEIRSITPEPERAVVDGDRIWYEFATDGQNLRTRVVFDLEAEEPWMQRGRGGTADARPLTFTQFVFP